MMSNAQPLVSVIVPIYNMQLYLRETIESVLKSTYANFELILIDDGSTDNSVAIAQEFANQRENVHFFAQKNGGASRARNNGIERASGKYILPVDADNLISVDYIEKAVEVLEQRADVKIVSCEAMFFGEKEGKWELPPFSLKLLARKNLMDNCAMYRKTDWQKAGGYCNEILGREDWDFWISMLKTGGEFVRLPIVGLHYRVRSNSKRKRTRNLKKTLIGQLNSRHKAFFYKHLGGKLHKSRTWSSVINFLSHITKPEKIIVLNNDFEDFVYNIPELYAENKSNSYEFKNTVLDLRKFSSRFSFKKSAAEKLLQQSTGTECIGIYVKRTILGHCESYFIQKHSETKPKATLIIAIYKNITFLNAVLNSLKQQSEQAFEIIIAEDGTSDEVKNFIEKYPFKQPWKHITQKDDGWRKNHAMNKAILASNTNWLIFIDGDCVLHPKFIEMHLRYADENKILAGKRVKLDSETTDVLLNENIDIQRVLTKKLLGKKGRIKFLEEGIYISPDGILSFIPKLRNLNTLKGCNMSFSKKAILAINGFDEDYVLPAIGEDIDLSWRFEAAGFKHKSMRNLAVQYHLHHKENWTSQELNAQKMLQKKMSNEYICKKGIKDLSK